MSIRGYAIDREVQQLLTLLNGRPVREHTELDPSPWKFRHSSCWWTACALDFELEGIGVLDGYENESLMDLHARVESLLTGKAPVPEVEGEDENPEQPARPAKKPFEDYTDLVRIARKRMASCLLDTQKAQTLERMTSEYAVHQRDARKPFSLRHDISRLMRLVVDCANSVVVTPIMSASKLYQSFNCWKAKAVLFDEAAAMHRADGLLVYGNSIRPAVIFEEEKQLPPAPMPMGAKRDDENAVNRFGQDAKISRLSWMLHLNIPAFHLYTQHRMARGMFEMGLELAYGHLKGHFSYGPSSALSNFPYANAIRNFVNDEHNLDLPPDTMSPVFIDCVDCPSRQDPVSKFRSNPRAVACMIQWLEKFVDALNFPQEKIVVITPYRAQMLVIHDELMANSLFSKVQTATIDSYQGRENDVVFLCLAVDRLTGPCFVAQPQRLNVATSRHKLSMAVFGDIQTSTAQEANTSIKAVTEEGTKVSIKPDVFRKFLAWFVTNNRVSKVQGDPTVDPDEEWSDSG